MQNNRTMTFKKLKRIIDKYNVSENVHLLSDSGWECSETEMCGVYYNKKQNMIIFTQEASEFEKYDKRNTQCIKGFVELKDDEE